MVRANFEHLKIYNLAEQLADSCWLIVRAWDNFSKDTVGKQLVRCADSIGANIAEGSGRASFSDNRRFANIARGSLYEVKHWLRRAYKRQLLSEGDVRQLRSILDNLLPGLNGYISSMKRLKERGEDQ